MDEISKAGSFAGYSFQEALYRNKDAVKAILAIITGANFLVGFDLHTFLITLASGGIALATKLLVDAVEFYFDEVNL